MLYLRWIHHTSMHDWSPVLQILRIKQRTRVCSVHGSLEARELTNNTMYDEASRHMPNIRECVFREHHCIRLFFNGLFRTSFKEVLLLKDFPLYNPSVSDTCMYKSGTPDSLPCLEPHVPGFTETILNRSIIRCQEAVSSLSGSEAAISPLNLSCRVVISNMKDSSRISDLMWHEFRSQSWSESDTVRGTFPLNPTRIAKQSWMKA